jgi:hypothetical protein
MHTYREVIDLKSKDIHIQAPQEFIGHCIEILLVKVDEQKEILLKRPKVGEKTSLPIVCDETAFAPLNDAELAVWELR